MRQAFRRYAFPMMIIAAVLAAALPLNCFAAGSVFLTRDFANSIFGVSGFDYFNISIAGLTNNHNGYPQDYISFGSSNHTSSPFDQVASSTLFGRSSERLEAYPYSIPVTLNFLVPIFLNDISSIDINFYFGLSEAQDYLDQSVFISAVNSVTLSSAVILSPSTPSIDASVSTSPGFYGFYCYHGISSQGFSVMRRFNLSYSSSTFFDVSFILLTFTFSDASQLPPSFYCDVAISSDSSITTLNGSTTSIIKSLSVMTSVLESFFASENQTNVQILDKLDDIIDYFTSNGSSGGESEDILEEGAEKQEQLEQLGDALSNVPKPSIHNITQSFDPADTLISADPGMIQNALSIVYSWDKFLILLGLFIAVGTISYIIFGKKS